MYNQWNNYYSFGAQFQPMFTPQFQPIFTPQFQQMFTPCGFLGINDIKAVDTYNLPYDTEKLFNEKDSSDPLDCLDHRGIQEELRNNFNYRSDQKAWNKNCNVIHKFRSGKYKK